MKQLLTILITISSFVLFGQIQQSGSWFDVGKTNLIFGINEGSHPNLISGKLNMYTSIESALTIKNIPINLSGRFSTEQFISGKSTFFRLSYDGFRKRGFQKRDLEGALVLVNEGIAKFQDSLYLLEAKIAYWKLKKQQLENLGTAPDLQLPNTKIPNLDIPNVDSISLSGLTKIEIPNLPTIPKNQNGEKRNFKLDSINALIYNFNTILQNVELKKDSLLGLKDQYIGKIKNIDFKSPNSLLGGIDKLDLGLTAMSHGSMSNNTIPIQGIRVKGKIGKTFYDAAAGTTVPNRLFSNSVFDQVTNNSQNIFNINQFYTVNKSRFISSVILGYGNEETNSVSFETYYNGKELKNFFSKGSNGTNVTTNISGNWQLSRNWHWNASVGKTFMMNDSTKRNLQQDMAASIGTKYRWNKLRTDLYAKFKQIGNNYDGFSQGLYNSGFSKMEIGLNTKISKSITAQLIGIRQKFNATNNEFRGMQTSSGTADIQWNVTRRLVVYGGYTLLNATGFDTLAKGLNHLGKGGFTWVKNTKSLRSEISSITAYSHINRIDSNMRLLNTTIHGVLDWKILGAGLQISMQDYTGLAAIYGVNWIFKPELKVHYKGITAQAAYHLLYSEQFGQQSGFSCKILASPSEYVTWEITGAKWLPTEAIYIPLYDTERYIPYYFDLKLRVFLNRNKK